LGSISKGKVAKVIKRGTIPNEMSQKTLQISLVIIVESNEISRLNVKILTKKRRRVLIGKMRRKLRKDVST